MRFRHTECGGEIDSKKRMCTRCKKKWNRISFMVTNEIRPIVDSRGRLAEDKVSAEALRKEAPKDKTYAKWADKLPGVSYVAKLLPKWPRWARILVTVILIVVVALIIYLVRR